MKKRTISAIILLIILIGSFIINSNLFGLIMILLSLIGFNEIFTIKYGKGQLKLIKWLGMICLFMITLGIVYDLFRIDSLILMPLVVLGLPIVFYDRVDKYNIEDYFYVLGSIYMLGFAFGNIGKLAINKAELCLFIFIISFITDTYAFIGGSLIGRRKFTKISPNKTIEGILIGSLMGTIIGATYYFYIVGGMSLISTVIFCLILTGLSEVGDLFFSSIKRYFNKKDYSNLIPGHGGILDRFDSVIYVSLGLFLLNGFI